MQSTRTYLSIYVVSIADIIKSWQRKQLFPKRAVLRLVPAVSASIRLDDAFRNRSPDTCIIFFSVE